MLAHVVRRIVATIPVMAIIALFVFSLPSIDPGDPAGVIAGDQASPEDVEKIRKNLGLDRPFLSRFGDWSWHILRADLGTSMLALTGLTRGVLLPKWTHPWLENLVRPAVVLGWAKHADVHLFWGDTMEASRGRVRARASASSAIP